MADDIPSSPSTSSKKSPISIGLEEHGKARQILPRNKGPPLKGNRFPAVASYAPSSIRGLKDAEMKLWCACGLSKKQPWCDGSHSGTGIQPLKWTVPCKQQRIYLICNCKYSKSPPYCDGTHVSLPMDYLKRIEQCAAKNDAHGSDEGDDGKNKLCTGCGWVPDF